MDNLKLFFTKYDCAYFHIRRGWDDLKRITNTRLFKYPVLKDLHFYNVKDSYQTYQDIEMFLANDLANVNQKPVPVGNDKVLASSKGYNKYSFRKDKTKK